MRVGGMVEGLLSKRSACIVLSDEGLGDGLWGVGRGCGGIVLLPSFLPLLFSHICRCIQSVVGRGGGVPMGAGCEGGGGGWAGGMGIGGGPG